jgi:hypothetical protein
MLRMIKIIVVACLLLTTAASAQNARRQVRRMQLGSRQRQWLSARETVSLAAAPAPQKYVEGAPLPVKLTFKNIGRKRMSFELVDKNEDPPGYIQVRVWGAGGELLTKNTTLEDGWWTVKVMSSDILFDVKKEDLVTLKPGEEYVLTIDLVRLLAGCDGLPEGLKAGAYRAQFSYGKVLSDEIEFSIGN